MLVSFKHFIKEVGASMGIVNKLGSVLEHKKVDVSDKMYNEMKINRELYEGLYPAIHSINYHTSIGTSGTRRMHTINMAKLSAQYLAKILFNEKCSITIAEPEQEAKEGEEMQPSGVNEMVAKVLHDNDFYREMQRYLEYMAALGGFALKTGYTKNRAGKYEIKIFYCTGEAFIPLSGDSEHVDEALFVNSFKKHGKFYTLLEFNEWRGTDYVITNELYVSEDEGQLGVKTALSDLFKDLEKEVVIKNLTRPKFVYFKTNLANNVDMTSPLGISIYQNARDTLHQLDYTFDYLYREMKLGKRRAIVSSHALQLAHQEDGSDPRVYFDPEEEVYQGLAGQEEKPVTEMAAALRNSTIIDTFNYLLSTYAAQVGFSSGTFSFDAKGLKTATEIVSENSSTYQTRSSFTSIIEEGIKDLIISIIDVNNMLVAYDKSRQVYHVERDRIGIDFDDSIFTDNNAQLDYYIKVANSRLMPKKEILQKLFSIPEAKAVEWLEEISRDELIGSPGYKDSQSKVRMFGENEGDADSVDLLEE